MDAGSTGTLFSEGESTKSGSSKSADERSGADVDIDFTKDNVGSPIDLECNIQAERITKIMNEALYKTKLAIVLPKLVQEYHILSTTLTPYHMDDLMFIFEQYDNPLFSSSLLNMAAMEDIKAGDVSLKNRLNPELGHLMYILHSYPALKPYAEKMIQDIKQEYYSRGPDKEPDPALEYLEQFEMFRELMVQQMHTTAADELHFKLQLRKLKDSNDKLVAKIERYTDTIKKEFEESERTMAIKADTIAKLEQELELLNSAATSKLKKKILDSERQMVLATRAHDVKKEMLKEEEVETRENYEKLLKVHLMDEKNQRARRFKVETQLLSWLQKYDTEMADKQIELDELGDKLEDERNKVDDLEYKLAEQNNEYLPLMEERDKEYHEEMTKKMEAFRLEHAVKVIQSAWKTMLANRAEKRKLKKYLDKLKKDKEKEEKRLEALRLKAEREAKKAAKAAKKAAKAAKK